MMAAYIGPKSGKMRETSNLFLQEESSSRQAAHQVVELWCASVGVPDPHRDDAGVCVGGKLTTPTKEFRDGKDRRERQRLP
jgi:hypothetical protein